MAKRKKRTKARKTTGDKKQRVADEQPSTSLTNVNEQNAPVTTEKSPLPDDNIILPEERENVAVSTGNDTQSPTYDISANIISNDNDVLPDEEEFIFAPIIHGSDESPVPLDLCTPQSQPCGSSTSEMAMSLISAIVGGTPKSSKVGGRTNRTQSIEVIDVDDLPDRPDSPIGDDVIEIIPGNSGSNSSGSPEIILNRRGFVDLTEPGEAESTMSDDTHGMEDEDEEDELLAPWPVHRKNVKPTLIPNKEPEPSPSRHKINCPICMDDYIQIGKDGKQLMSTSCGHVFCHVCIKAAVASQKRCPTCRKKLALKNLHPIFL